MLEEELFLSRSPSARGNERNLNMVPVASSAELQANEVCSVGGRGDGFTETLRDISLQL